MEQLVHLRLKSIYKAFKQSSNGASALAAAAAGSSKGSGVLSDTSGEDVEALMMAAAAASALAPAVIKDEAALKSDRERETVDHKTSKEEYEKKVKRADDAAAALLAELDDEEEQAIKSKKKKKRKKKGQQPLQKKEVKKPEEVFSDRQEVEENAEVEKNKSFDTLDSVADEVSAKESNFRAKDSLESDFKDLIDREDIDGLEKLLASIKGVPGKGVLRKNVKKALKRLKITQDEEPEEGVSDAPETERSISPAQEDTSCLETANAEEDPRVAELLQVVSYTDKALNGMPRTKIPNPKGSSECIMHMAPVIVGWVIGKGGQRIRDLMEDSGARIWIDQDSMKAHEPRVVYVSGNRRSVDVAVQMIKDLIGRAPTETPKSLHSTPKIETPSKTAAGSLTGKVPSVPNEFPTGGEKYQLKPRETSTSGSSKTKHEMTCDPRFVPLLIGRRGWTIKNIQDASGARIDIDQTVTPRKITVSGNKTSVEIARGMVQDVLSYPQSQLHGAGNDENVSSPVATRELSPKSPSDRAPGTVAQSQPTSPPPTAEILAPDNKDVVSAASSLSTTPEPAAAVKSVSQNIGGGFFLPPVAHSMSPVRAPSNPGFRVERNPFAQDSVDIALVSQSTAANDFSLQTGNAQSFGPRSGAPTRLYHAPGVGGHETKQVGPTTNTPANFPQSHLHGHSNEYGSSAFQSPLPGHAVGVGSPLPDLSATRSGPETNNTVPGLWTGPMDRSPVASQGAGEFGLVAAVDFLQHNSPRTQLPANLLPQSTPSGSFPPHISGAAPNIPLHQNNAFGSPSTKIDLNVVDSLFGPSPPVNEPDGLISGLGGLSLGRSRESGSLWGSGTLEKGSNLPPIGGGLLPDLPSSATEQDKSRFAWGGQL